jgi:hypothetical protein
MKNQGLSESIIKAIKAFPEEYAFTSKDLADLADPTVVRQTLVRLNKDGVIRRVLRGVYDVPRYSTFLKEFVPPSPSSIARAIARAHRWTIVPTGVSALNLLGLSTQVPAKWMFLSDGPSKTISWDGGEIQFSHRTNKEITALSPMTALVVQALKALERSRINEKVISTVAGQMTPDQKKAALVEAKIVTSWVYQAIKQICREEGGTVA